MPPSTKKSIPYYIVVFCLLLIGLAFLFGLLWQESFKQGVIYIPFFKGYLGFWLWEFIPVVISLLLFVYCFIKAVKSLYQNKFFILSLLFGLVAITGIYLLPVKWSITYASHIGVDTESISTKYLLRIYVLMGSLLFSILFLFYQRYKILRRMK